MSHLWHKEWRVVKWRRWKNMQKWANVSEPLGKINQMKFWPTSFWQLCMQPACILHAHLSRLSFSELDWFWWVFCTHIIWVFCNHQLTYLHAHFYHEVQNVCQLSRLCALHAISKSKWYVDYQTPYPMQGFLWKGGSIRDCQKSFRVQYPLIFPKCSGNCPLKYPLIFSLSGFKSPNFLVYWFINCVPAIPNSYILR